MLCAAVVLLALGSWGHLNPQELVIATHFDHVYWFGCIAAVLTGVALVQLIKPYWLKVLIAVPTTLIVMLWGFTGLTLGGFGDSEVVAEVPAPHAPYRATVRLEYDNVPDPVWSVSITQTEGLGAREFTVGCISGDDPDYTFRKVWWADAEHLVVRAGRHTTTVRIDPRTADPHPVHDAIWNWPC